MAWLTPDETMVSTWLHESEWETYRTHGLIDGQSDPLPDVIRAVVGRLRSAVAGCSRNSLGPAGSIPEELLSEARALFLDEFASRIPGANVVIDEPRQKRIDAARRTLRDVATCLFAITPPAETAPTPAPPSYSEIGGDCAVDFSKL